MLQGGGEEKYEQDTWSLYEQESTHNKNQHQTAKDAEDAIGQGLNTRRSGTAFTQPRTWFTCPKCMELRYPF